MYLSLIITFLILLALVITGIQNSMPLELKFVVWNLQMSLTALIFCASLFGGAIVAALTLPKLVKKSFQVRRLNREMVALKERGPEGNVGAEGMAAGRPDHGRQSPD
ncbi:MAG: LapA family protein [Desulfobacteraceae bacterium]|nr:MAG: LapA family protein [Desulfobacteraceae bacterium]